MRPEVGRYRIAISRPSKEIERCAVAVLEMHQRAGKEFHQVGRGKEVTLVLTNRADLIRDLEQTLSNALEAYLRRTPGGSGNLEHTAVRKYG